MTPFIDERGAALRASAFTHRNSQSTENEGGGGQPRHRHLERGQSSGTDHRKPISEGEWGFRGFGRGGGGGLNNVVVEVVVLGFRVVGGSASQIRTCQVLFPLCTLKPLHFLIPDQSSHHRPKVMVQDSL